MVFRFGFFILIALICGRAAAQTPTLSAAELSRMDARSLLNYFGRAVNVEGSADSIKHNIESTISDWSNPASRAQVAEALKKAVEEIKSKPTNSMSMGQAQAQGRLMRTMPTVIELIEGQGFQARSRNFLYRDVAHFTPDKLAKTTGAERSVLEDMALQERRTADLEGGLRGKSFAQPEIRANLRSSLARSTNRVVAVDAVMQIAKSAIDGEGFDTLAERKCPPAHSSIEYAGYFMMLKKADQDLIYNDCTARGLSDRAKNLDNEIAEKSKQLKQIFVQPYENSKGCRRKDNQAEVWSNTGKGVTISYQFEGQKLKAITARCDESKTVYVYDWQKDETYLSDGSKCAPPAERQPLELFLKKHQEGAVALWDIFIPTAYANSCDAVQSRSYLIGAIAFVNNYQTARTPSEVCAMIDGPKTFSSQAVKALWIPTDSPPLTAAPIKTSDKATR